MKGKILVVTFYFPPHNRVGVRRMTHLVHFLHEREVDVIVLKGDNKFYGRAMDQTYTIHPFRVINVDTDHIKLPLPVTLNVFYDYFFWNRAFRRAIEQIVIAEPIQAVLFTGDPFFYFTVGVYIKKKYGIPYILDFRDPWLAGHQEKLRFTRPLLLALESKAVRAAELIFDVTPAMSLCRRDFYHQLDPNKFKVFENGFENNLVEGLPAVPAVDPAGGTLNLGIWGKFSYYSKADTDALFTALKKMKQETRWPVRLKFICDPDIERYALQRTKRMFLEKEVDFIEYGGYREGLQLLASLDCLVLNHRSPLMVGTKIYDYLYLNKPILAFAKPKSAIADMLMPYKNAFLVSNVDQVLQALKCLYQTKPRQLQPDLKVDDFSRDHAAAEAFPAIMQVLRKKE